MIEVVIAFAVVSIITEMIFLGMVPARARLAMLGSKAARTFVHVGMLVLTLWVHWGTVTGTMTAFTSFLLSFPAVFCAQQLWGWTYKTEDGERRLRRGIINYSVAELQ